MRVITLLHDYDMPRVTCQIIKQDPDVPDFRIILTYCYDILLTYPNLVTLPLINSIVMINESQSTISWLWNMVDPKMRQIAQFNTDDDTAHFLIRYLATDDKLSVIDEETIILVNSDTLQTGWILKWLIEISKLDISTSIIFTGMYSCRLLSA